MRQLALVVALLALVGPPVANADQWVGTGLRLTERAKWQYELATADVVVLARVVEVKDGIVDSVRTARADAVIGNGPLSRLPDINGPFLRAVARLQPVATLKGALPGKEILAYHAYGRMAPAPRLEPLTLAAGVDTLAVFAFLRHDSTGYAFDDERGIFPAGCIAAGQSRWQPRIDEAKRWGEELRVDSLVAQADVVARPTALMFGAAGNSLDLVGVIRGVAAPIVPVRPFLLANYHDLPPFVCLRRGDDGVYEPIPEWWGFRGRYLPAASDSVAVVQAVARLANVRPAGGR